MVNKTKMLGLGATLMLLVSAGASLTSCGGTNYDLTYWCPGTDNAVMEEIVADFKTAYPDYASKSIGLSGNYGEGETFAQLDKDVSAAADVIAMVDDNIRAAVKAQDLQALSAEDKAAAIASDGAAAVSALTIDDTMYGYPYRNDNSPEVFYDKTVFTDAIKLNRLEDMLAVCKAAGKKLYLNLTDSWYTPFILWAGGATFKVDSDGLIETDAAKGKLTACTAAAEACYSLFGEYKGTWVSDNTQASVESGFKDGSIAVSFLWNDLTNIKAGNANVAVAPWPSMSIGGVDTPLCCFQSYKSFVVKAGISDTSRLTLAETFAKFCCGEAAQLRRVKELSYGASNLKVQATAEAAALPFSSAISKMTLAGLTRPQATSTTSSFWNPVKAFGTHIANQDSWGANASAKVTIKSMVSNTGWKSVDF